MSDVVRLSVIVSISVHQPCGHGPNGPYGRAMAHGTLGSTMRLELTRRADYGIRAMIAIARASSDAPLSTPRIAESMAIPVRFLPQVMADLSRVGLVDSTGGRRGGYRLGRAADAITLLDIIEALEGDTRRLQCVLRAAPCGRDGHCDVHAVFADAQDALLDRFRAARLSHLAGPRRG
ncbi:MAG TPA: Rrf2 family transcriptional regulator [Candidatus Saccharimonadia bacterium]|nr:Rrf2 family transcriptional regulator [Candidatus Saccharimonadia bacterium]